MLQLDRVDSTKLDRARALVRDLGSVLVAYSGGVDSTLLLKLALEELPAGRAVAVLADSPAYPEAEQAAARQLARELGARLVEVQTHELELDEYKRNQPDRCFHCKEELFDTLEPVRDRLGLEAIAYGATASDLGDHRPGHRSAIRRGVRFPLLEAGMSKAEVRAAARTLGLPNWAKPSFACLSSRIPHGTPVTTAALRRIEAAEAVLQRRGFTQVRVRDDGRFASVEVAPDEVPALTAIEPEVAVELRNLGYAAVKVDPDGYETGKLTRSLAGKRRA